MIRARIDVPELSQNRFELRNNMSFDVDAYEPISEEVDEEESQ